MAKTLLHRHRWAIDVIVHQFRADPRGLLVASRLQPEHPAPELELGASDGRVVCAVCLLEVRTRLWGSADGQPLSLFNSWTYLLLLSLACRPTSPWGCTAIPRGGRART